MFIYWRTKSAVFPYEVVCARNVFLASKVFEARVYDPGGCTPCLLLYRDVGNPVYLFTPSPDIVFTATKTNCCLFGSRKRDTHIMNIIIMNILFIL